MYERRRTAPARGAATAQRSMCRRDKRDRKRESQDANNNPLDGTDGPGRRGGRVRARLLVRSKKFGRKRRRRGNTGAGRSSPATRQRRSQREEPERSERSL